MDLGLYFLMSSTLGNLLVTLRFRNKAQIALFFFLKIISFEKIYFLVIPFHCLVRPHLHGFNHVARYNIWNIFASEEIFFKAYITKLANSLRHIR